ncbi:MULTISPECIES: bifunctional helix-turn-helix transcriptional regulator/GNAT family N-acetyltransferase [unclassified Oceanispirochaeta]|uniref:bifunctional helix-turn-helix transcriptional regulator/GNAT family N-acetyltransferase n=1 Tax=unclassified Oceanispirochaeta TaxID=2635722 RepID=UPI000E099987|nr:MULTISPECIES: bifunctional helix-turn-helix transcriptional regulator/GNAT family N-acetyltransferase [unclassified Oceanispirochaeta]MBF9018814.1 bifunctional helix-turn-helix transcriptional regulator/GNAT family N-acetyltransferase [Oceanispirochaeta sp. M2]NPD75283.1 bifunctional helix-turn-helix transcriptional regulator/GNAT family N-acetyltransferase [Oceanispirochaeta sp. M1]RDG28874.1 GNAT family N-acetyltransferase [Oceanispirochaeta sp. M1]
MRKKWSDLEKARIAQMALREEKTISEIAQDTGAHPNMISKWKRELIGNADSDFHGGKSENEGDMENKITFRVADSEDIHYLKEMLFEAVYWRSIKQGNAPNFEEGLKAEGVMNSLIDWGKRKQDLGLIALNGSNQIGAAWIRYYQKSNSIRGFIEDSVPVLVIGIKNEYRNKGIGTEILNLLIEKAKGKCINSISLMVSEDNEAYKLYRKVGFELKEKHGDSLLMIMNF